MGIEWFRDLSITIMGFAAAALSIALAIVVIRLQRTAKEALQELKVASILARDTAEMVHDGVQPVASMLGFFRAMSHEHDRRGTREQKRRR